MIENDAHGLLQNLITAPMIYGLPLAEGKKKAQKLSQVNQERPFEFTMNTSTWFKKRFNQDFIFCKYMLPSECELFISTSAFWARLLFGLKRHQISTPAFQGFLWFTSVTSGDFSFCIWGLAETPLFSPIGGSDSWNFQALIVHFLNSFSFFKTWNHFLFSNKETSFGFMKICYEFLSWLAKSLHCKIKIKVKNHLKSKNKIVPTL